jgi:ubiquinone/menaquinone biosynthesis C-methylase UbiE
VGHITRQEGRGRVRQIKSASEIAKKEGFFWGDEVSVAYFDAAENFMDRHWAEIIGPFIDNIPYETALDLASGHGRNALRLGKKASLVYCIDINPENIRFLQSRFASSSKFIILQNDGYSLPVIEDNHIDLFYCYDALVHFDLEIVQCSVREAYRVIKTGGHAFIHCSNYTENPGGDFRENPHWRNFMSCEIFTHLARKAGFTVLRGDKLAWGGIRDLDCVFLLRKD